MTTKKSFRFGFAAQHFSLDYIVRRRYDR